MTKRGRPRATPPGFDVLVARLKGHGLRAYAIASVLSVDPATVKRSLARTNEPTIASVKAALAPFLKDGHLYTRGHEHDVIGCTGLCAALRKALGEDR